MVKSASTRAALLPYPIIAAAVRGEPDAVNTVIRHYSGYIAALSTRTSYDVHGCPYSYVDEELRRRLAHEVTFSELPEDSMEQLASYDRYPWEYTSFPVRGDVILIENDRLAEALNALPQDGRNILLMYFFLDMADREIAERMHVARRTVNARRQKAYRLLKELMGGDVDD